MNFKLSTTVRRKWVSNQLIFLRPLAIFIGLLYIGFLIPRIEDNGIQLSDFVPTNSVFTAAALYIFNGIYDYLRKLK